MRRIYLLLILSVFSVILSAKGNNEANPALVKIIELDESINIPSNIGGLLSLPKYETVSENLLSPSSILERKLDLSGDYTLENLYKQREKQAEMASLSQKLGIDIVDDDYLDFYREVASWLGTRYRMGGMSRKAVDCSGFTNIIYNTVFHKEIPRVSTVIANTLSEELPIDELLPGDLVFFRTRGRNRINHVGMYIGDGQFVHASIKGVKVSDLSDGYYKRTFQKAGRI
ncbi:C40 family peptidase [Dysgonomonas sp. 25]|uniref:C40 family peptidase n=1 Tax=Dysgonomonas sp. 25 TaxID=2302933 RepID=UPI0013D1B9F7|nr:NlpC/P60 family protein [Dysgonomonas sp. 25]NDV68402.1 NlpC/P60 family protein [Dysgonomonas sp. 25]